MAEVSGELIYEVLKNLQQRTTNVEVVPIEHSKELQALRGNQNSIGTHLNNIYGVLSRIDGRLDRIGRRLELREPAELGTPYRPA